MLVTVPIPSSLLLPCNINHLRELTATQTVSELHIAIPQAIGTHLFIGNHSSPTVSEQLARTNTAVHYPHFTPHNNPMPAG